MQRNTRRQPGFTLVELLVVITIIGMLMALLLPAVNAAVEQSRNITCKNNMRNIATGCVSFESSRGRFPGYSEWIDGSEDPNNNNKPFIRSWSTVILPQLDHHDWYEEFRRARGSAGSSFAFASELFVCPSNPPTTGLGGWTAFCINAGYWWPMEGGVPSPPALEIPADGIAHNASLEDEHGNLLAVATTLDYVSANDGSSYTVLISENVNQSNGLHPVTKTPMYWWDAGKVGSTMVWHQENSPEIRKINNRGENASLQQIKLDKDGNASRPSSYHTGGVNMAFCDMRTLFIRETIAYRVYQHLLTPNGRESSMPVNVRQVPLSEQEYN